MAITQYLQVGTDESFYVFDTNKIALIINQYGADILVKSGNILVNNDLIFYDAKTCLIAGDGAVYFPIGKTSPTPIDKSYLLLEDGGYILLETGDKILLQRQ